MTWLTLHRPERDNALDGAMLDGIEEGLVQARRETGVLVLRGLPEVFCTGADLSLVAGPNSEYDHAPERVYQLWTEMIESDVIIVCHVRGRASAGGVGLAAAADIVVADMTAAFALPEMLFGLMPAMVLPFLARRVGWHRAHFMTLSTRTIDVETAAAWGLVDVYDARSEVALGRLLARLRRVPRDAVTAYKTYAAQAAEVESYRELAVAANRSRFADSRVRARISAFTSRGLMPWEVEDAGAGPCSRTERERDLADRPGSGAMGTIGGQA
ncbi:SiaC protein [Actinomyces sp. Chiba101]|nr:SiaC protein [Actinomyces sp. Chiba101]GAV95590.1 hypothetical protein ADENT20671_2389 [Actinomyces denticolens]SUU04563.1 Probable polyketide biosynthesis enoyl-CoA hydratase pksH [Actinomyces denticolens]